MNDSESCPMAGFDISDVEHLSSIFGIRRRTWLFINVILVFFMVIYIKSCKLWNDRDTKPKMLIHVTVTIKIKRLSSGNIKWVYICRNSVLSTVCTI